MQKGQQQTKQQQTLIYNYRKISQFIITFQREIAYIRILCKKISKNNETASQDIIKIIQHKNQFLQLYTDTDKQRQRYLKKQLNNIDFLVLEKDQYEANEIWIKNNVDNWIETSMRLVRNLQDKAKKLESKRLGKILINQQVIQFKNDLIKSTAQHRQSVHDMVRSLSQWNIKNCCGLIENLTTNMQQIRISEKKRQNRKIENQKKKVK